jgi:hypothetical protein
MSTFTKNKVTKQGEVGAHTPDASEDVGEEQMGTAGVEERTKEREREKRGDAVEKGDEHPVKRLNR